MRAPVEERTARRPITTARSPSAASITVRRSKRSLTTPPGSRQAIVGTVIAIPITESAAGAFQSA